jgi:hypothetical protein
MTTSLYLETPKQLAARVGISERQVRHLKSDDTCRITRATLQGHYFVTFTSTDSVDAGNAERHH